MVDTRYTRRAFLKRADASGNTGEATYPVSVPVEQGGAVIDSGPRYTVDGCTPVAPSSAAVASLESPAAEEVEAVLEMEEVPEVFALEGNYPNPFNPSNEIRFSLPEAVQVRLVVYDVLGREVARLVEEPLAAGVHSVRFEASALPSGTYLYRIEAGAFTETRRMVLLK